jgi:hypothetical protein
LPNGHPLHQLAIRSIPQALLRFANGHLRLSEALHFPALECAVLRNATERRQPDRLVKQCVSLNCSLRQSSGLSRRMLTFQLKYCLGRSHESNDITRAPLHLVID